MDKQILDKRIYWITKKIHRLKSTIIDLQNTDVDDDPDNYEELSHLANTEGEYLVLKLRDFIFNSGIGQREMYLEKAAIALGITIREDDGVIEIELPCLIPGRKIKATDFIIDPLYAVLSKFVSERQVPFEKFKHCAVCITHVYDKAFMSKRRIRGYDNIELRGIMNTINIFLLTDDSGLLCDYVNVNEISDRDVTRITIMEKSRLYQWVMKFTNGQNYEQK